MFGRRTGRANGSAREVGDQQRPGVAPRDRDRRCHQNIVLEAVGHRAEIGRERDADRVVVLVVIELLRRAARIVMVARGKETDAALSGIEPVGRHAVACPADGAMAVEANGEIAGRREVVLVDSPEISPIGDQPTARRSDSPRGVVVIEANDCRRIAEVDWAISCEQSDPVNGQHEMGGD